MSDDPWGEDTNDDTPPWEIDSQQDSQVAKRRSAQAGPEPESASAKKEATTRVVEPSKSQSEEGRYDGISVTFKGNGSFDQPWIVVHASTVSDALKEISDKAFGELIKKAQQVGSFWSNLAGANSSNPAAASSSGGGGGERKGTPPKAVDPEPGEHFCKHGEREYKSGVSGAGKAWAGWMCSEPKDSSEKCAPQWHDKKKS